MRPTVLAWHFFFVVSVSAVYLQLLYTIVFQLEKMTGFLVFLEGHSDVDTVSGLDRTF